MTIVEVGEDRKYGAHCAMASDKKKLGLIHNAMSAQRLRPFP